MKEKELNILISRIFQAISFSTEEQIVRDLALDLCNRSKDVEEPGRSKILNTLPDTLFISHTSKDDNWIKDKKIADEQNIWSICWESFYDPFYHSYITGGASTYEAIVGLALLSSVRVLIIWSKKSATSPYVRAEILLSSLSDKRIAAYITADAPPLPIKDVPLISDLESLRFFLKKW